MRLFIPSLFQINKQWLWCDYTLTAVQILFALESWPSEFASLVLLHSPWSGSAACVYITNLESGVAKLLGNLKWLRYRFLVTKTKSLWMTEALHEKRVRSKNYNFSSQSLFFLFQVKMFLLAISYRFIWSRTASHFSQPFWKRLSVVWISKFRAENKAYCGIK